MTDGPVPVKKIASFDALSLAASVLGPLALYVLTMPRTVVLEDDGLFLMAGADLGIAHPPGYPLYTLIIYMFMQLPFASPAFLGHLSSAVLAALACGAVYVCARLLQPSRLAALAGAWLFAASEHFWSQAIIAEVYALNALLFFSLYALLLYAVREPARSWPWTAAAVAYGLSLANHWPLMGLATPGLALMAWPAWRAVWGRLPLMVVVSLLSAALPYGWLVWRSLQQPAISFYGAIGDWDDLWFYVSRKGYVGSDASPSAGWGDRLELLQWFGAEVAWQLTLPGLVLALVGVWVLLRQRQHNLMLSGLLVFVGQSVLLIALLSFDFDFFQISVFRPYSLICYGLMALWLAVGLGYVVERLFEWLPRDGGAARTGLQIRGMTWTAAGAMALAGLAMTALSVQANWQVNDRSASDFGQLQAEAILDGLPRDAILMVHSDANTGVLGYYQFVEQRRPDVTLMNVQGLVYGNRLISPLESARRRQAALKAFAEQAERPVYYTTDEEKFPHGLGIRYHGFVKEARKDGVVGTVTLQRNPVGEAVFRKLVQRGHVADAAHPWEQQHRNSLLAFYGHYLGLYVLANDPALTQTVAPLLALGEQNFASLIGMIEIVLLNWNPRHAARVKGWMEAAQRLEQETALSKNPAAHFLYMKGFLSHQLGDRDAAISYFRQSLELYDHPENESADALKQMGL